MNVWSAAAAAMARADAEKATIPPGRLAWAINGSRCYIDTEQIAITHPGRPTIIHCFPGLDIDAMV